MRMIFDEEKVLMLNT